MLTMMLTAFDREHDSEQLSNLLHMASHALITCASLRCTTTDDDRRRCVEMCK